MRARVARLKDRLVKRKLRLAVAESMTGGALSDLITSVPGASRYFVGGMISYSPELKAMMGVSAGTIKKHGVYSKQVAEGLARGALKRFGSDVAVGITGIAHPDRTHRAPGAWVAVASDRKVVSKHIACKAGTRRNEARKKVARGALEILLEFIRNWD
jgi:PncC family amidohydrolase